LYADTPCLVWLQSPEPLQIRRGYAYLDSMEKFAVTDRAATRIAEIVA
jgi:hypothetical protein